MTKILLYAFKPFGKNNHNTSEDVLNYIPTSKLIKKVILQTHFEKITFLDLINRYHPDIILGVGQYPKGNKIRIETRAVNQFGSLKTKKFQSIDSKGPDCLFTTLNIKPDVDCIISDDAGVFVCNFSMYVLLKECLGKKIRFGFIHIPKRFDQEKAVKFIQKTLDLI